MRNILVKEKSLGSHPDMHPEKRIREKVRHSISISVRLFLLWWISIIELTLFVVAFVDFNSIRVQAARSKLYIHKNFQIKDKKYQ